MAWPTLEKPGWVRFDSDTLDFLKKYGHWRQQVGWYACLYRAEGGDAWTPDEWVGAVYYNGTCFETKGSEDYWFFSECFNSVLAATKFAIISDVHTRT